MSRIQPAQGWLMGRRSGELEGSPTGARGSMPKLRQPRRSNATEDPEFAARVGRALLRVGESARRIARMHGTPPYVWEKGLRRQTSADAALLAPPTM